MNLQNIMMKRGMLKKVIHIKKEISHERKAIPVYGGIH
jgi:hypothetical protein